MKIKAMWTFVSLLASNTCSILSRKRIKVLSSSTKLKIKNHFFHGLFNGDGKVLMFDSLHKLCVEQLHACCVCSYVPQPFALLYIIQNACKQGAFWNKESWHSELRLGKKPNCSKVWETGFFSILKILIILIKFKLMGHHKTIRNF